MDFLGLVLRWAHVLSAVALAGGTYFWRLVVVPAVSDLDTETRERVVNQLARPWAGIVMASSGLLLASGLYNAVVIIIGYKFPPGAAYHGLVAVKLLVALAVFWLSARLAGRSDAARQVRQNLKFWTTLNAVLVTVLILLGGWMKLTPRTEKPAEEPGTAVSAVVMPGGNLDV